MLGAIIYQKNNHFLLLKYRNRVSRKYKKKTDLNDVSKKKYYVQTIVYGQLCLDQPSINTM